MAHGRSIVSRWTARHETIAAKAAATKLYLLADEQPMSFAGLLRLLATSEDFADWYSDLLRATGPVAYFWEHPPLTRANCGSAAEFVLLEAPALANSRPDRSSFAQHFATAESDIAIFESLGGDARLIAPCPLSAQSDYAHLGAFLHNAPTSQIHSLWRHIGLTTTALLGTQPLWLSTSGLGVSWLHIRLDTRPKYYQHQPYKTV